MSRVDYEAEYNNRAPPCPEHPEIYSRAGARGEAEDYTRAEAMKENGRAELGLSYGLVAPSIQSTCFFPPAARRDYAASRLFNPWRVTGAPPRSLAVQATWRAGSMPIASRSAIVGYDLCPEVTHRRHYRPESDMHVLFLWLRIG